MHDDQELVRRTLRGDRGAFEEIVRRYQQAVINYIGRMVREREMALDFSQEIFLKVYSSLRSYRPQFKFSTWLFKIASNYMIDYWRKRKIATTSYDQPVDGVDGSACIQVTDDGPSVSRQYEMQELRGRIEEAMDRLPPALRELFVWRHVNGFSYEEMADIKSLPVGTVKNRVFQAKEMLKQLLEEPA
ncbi:MAG: sigma-70 family RNA polymerase sigma factor [Candidatus Aminicenantes bacterium]|nr:sigma-70 family RNA polymerase sigma factor [Candidatus Aminicenantes bacterium]